MLDEQIEKNYLRKHVLAWEKMCNENTTGNEHARIFASKPGTYGNGVNLAVYASAWQAEKDFLARTEDSQQRRERFSGRTSVHITVIRETGIR